MSVLRYIPNVPLQEQAIQQEAANAKQFNRAIRNVVFHKETISSITKKGRLLPEYRTLLCVTAEFLQKLRCSLTKNFEACYLENAAKAIPILANGLPEWDIPKLNPLHLSFLQAISSPGLSVNLTDTKIYGLEEVRPVKLEQLENSGVYRITFEGKNITMIGEYSADGKISIMPMKGGGPFSIYVENAVFKIKEPVQNVVKDGEEYLVSRNISLESNFGKIVFHFDNLFEGNEQLGDEFNKFLNENTSIIMDEFGGGILEHVRALIKRIVETFSENVPTKDLYLP